MTSEHWCWTTKGEEFKYLTPSCLAFEWMCLVNFSLLQYSSTLPLISHYSLNPAKWWCSITIICLIAAIILSQALQGMDSKMSSDGSDGRPGKRQSNALKYPKEHCSSKYTSAFTPCSSPFQSLLPLYPCKEVPLRGKSSPPLESACRWTRARMTWGRRRTTSTSTSTTSTLQTRATISTTQTTKWTGKVGKMCKCFFFFGYNSPNQRLIGFLLYSQVLLDFPISFRAAPLCRWQRHCGTSKERIY